MHLRPLTAATALVFRLGPAPVPNWNIPLFLTAMAVAARAFWVGVRLFHVDLRMFGKQPSRPILRNPA